jgi:hypothetical protein
MVPKPISTAYFINPPQQSVPVCVSTIISRQQLGKNDTATMITHNNTRILDMLFSMQSMFKENRRLVLPEILVKLRFP